jgi:virginiamycin B lyase
MPGKMKILHIWFRVACGLIILAAVTLTRADSPDLKAVRRRTSDLHAAAKIPVPGSPDWAAIGDSVRISNHPKNNVSTIDPKTNTTVATIPVGNAPCAGLAVGFGSVWVPHCGDGSVWRLDLQTHLPGAGGDIATGDGSVWVTAIGTPLSRIDPATNRLLKQYIGKGGDALRFGVGSL